MNSSRRHIDATHRSPQKGDRSLSLAVDGGGTKTAFLLFDWQSGDRLARAECPGINKFPRKDQHTTAILGCGLEELRKQHPFQTLSHSWLALAGPDWNAELISKNHPELGCLRIIPDITAVLGAVDRSQPGVVIHAGTGSFAAAWTAPDAAFYTGGAGWIIGDPGSGVDLGRRALRAQRSCPAADIQCLKQAIEEQFAKPLAEVVSDLYGHPDPSSILASIAPAVIAGTHQGDPLCLLIVNDSTLQLLSQATTLASTMGLAASAPLFVSGRLLNFERTRQAVTRHISKLGHFRTLIPLTTPPLEGVQSLMINTLRHQLAPPVLKRFNI